MEDNFELILEKVGFHNINGNFSHGTEYRCSWDEDGNLIRRPHWFELAKQKWCRIYKTTGTPCSCWMCRGESYNRLDYKKETLRIITEELEE